MNKKGNVKHILITILITLVVGCVLFLNNLSEELYEEANTFYQVYLGGKNIGTINSSDSLYSLIDENQSVIKEQYNVTTVYPPTDLLVIETSSFASLTDNIDKVYQAIAENDNFTIKGYVVEVKGEHNFSINILDKEVFYNATKRFVKAFLEENEYEQYINNSQNEIEGVGYIIENMYFTENITIKEAYLSVNDKIYTDEVELSQFLLFGLNPDTKSYTVKLGDTIETIAYENKLNSEEFLIANPNLKSQDTILRVGDNVNVTLIDPVLSFVYDLYEVKDEIVYFTNDTPIYDPNRDYGTQEITQVGINGINRVTEKYSVTNGVREQGVELISTEVIREVQNKVVTIGTKVYTSNYVAPNPVVIDGDWGWPTNKGYVITSYYEYRWGSMHSGLDISGAGNYGSPIYAVADGVVITANNGCPGWGNGYGDTCGGGLGNKIIIDHQNGYYTMYGHLQQKLLVSVGTVVKKGQQIGYMGNSGSSTGPHVHFSVAKGGIYNYFNPLLLYK